MGVRIFYNRRISFLGHERHAHILSRLAAGGNRKGLRIYPERAFFFASADYKVDYDDSNGRACDFRDTLDSSFASAAAVFRQMEVLIVFPSVAIIAVYDNFPFDDPRDRSANAAYVRKIYGFLEHAQSKAARYCVFRVKKERAPRSVARDACGSVCYATFSIANRR